MTKLLRFFRPSHQHTAFSATLLLISAVMMSRVIGYARDAYIAYAYGAGGATDAYVAAFTLPDFLNYIVAGGAASITFISIYTRFLAEKRDADAQKTFSIIITVMTAVMIVGTIVTEIFAPQFIRWFVKGFSPDKIELCVHLTRILLPAQIFFYVGGVVSAVLLSHRLFLFPAFGPLIYNVFIILGGVIGGKHFGIASLAYGALIGSFAGPFLASVIGALQGWTGYRPSFDMTNPAFREWVKLSVPANAGGFARDRRRLDSAALRRQRRGRHYAAELCKAFVRRAHCGAGASDRAGVAAIFRAPVQREKAERICRHGERFGVQGFGRLVSGDWMDDGGCPAADRSGLSAGKISRSATPRPAQSTSSGSRSRWCCGRRRDSMRALSMPPEIR